ncbi:MAG: FtsX-like permease family protein [Clostridia bacterium]|nr:FtsX-like permease family protein [Clostridia bacterium]
MKLTSLAISNIKHNMKNYAMYFFSMCFSVFTTYSFANLALSETISESIQSSIKYKNTFIGFGIVILIFVMFFLISSNKSFIRYRKREISTYALFGMENGKIGRMLFFETLVIGAAALIIGIAIGIFFSKLMVMILLKMVLAEVAEVSFAIEWNAILMTSAAYFIIYCIMGLSGLRVINKFQLVDLFKGDKIAEKRTKGSIALLIISAILIIVAYRLAIDKHSYIVVMNMFLVIGMTIAGTYLFFFGGLQKLLDIVKKNKNIFYKKTRLVSVSLLSHKAKTFAATMGTIAVLIASSTTAMAFGYTLYKSAENNAKELNSFDVYYYGGDETIENEIYELLEKNGSEPLDFIKVEQYVTKPEGENFPESIIWLSGDSLAFSTYSQSTFNKISEASQDSNPMVDVKEGTALIAYPGYYADFEHGEPVLKYGDISIKAEFEPLPNTYSNGSYATIIFNDKDYEMLNRLGYVKSNDNGRELSEFIGINYKNSLYSKEIAAGLNEILRSNETINGYHILYDTYIESMTLFGLLCFIGYFISAVFILMSVSLLYFKQIAIGTEEISQYESLRRIGIDKDQENKIITNRIWPVFFIPLVMGLIHSVFAMKGADTILFSNMIYTDGNSYLEVLKTSSVMYIIYSLVYFVFYLITKYKYIRIVSNKQN